MLELRLLHTSTGVFVTANRASLEDARAYLKPQTVYSVTLTQPSSNKQSALLHVACQLAFDNQRAGPECASWRHLKSWVLCAVGHCSEHRWPQGSLTPEVAHQLRQGIDTLVFSQDRDTGEVIMRTASTTAGLSMEAYSELLDKVLAKLSEVFVPGMDIEDLKREIGADKHDAKTRRSTKPEGAPPPVKQRQSAAKGSNGGSRKPVRGERKKPATAHAGHAARRQPKGAAGTRAKAGAGAGTKAARSSK